MAVINTTNGIDDFKDACSNNVAPGGGVTVTFHGNVKFPAIDISGMFSYLDQITPQRNAAVGGNVAFDFTNVDFSKVTAASNSMGDNLFEDSWAIWESGQVPILIGGGWNFANAGNNVPKYPTSLSMGVWYYTDLSGDDMMLSAPMAAAGESMPSSVEALLGVSGTLADDVTDGILWLKLM